MVLQNNFSICRNKRIAQLVFERREVGHAMSWLSTFGGAFSALGDEFEHCVSILIFIK